MALPVLNEVSSVSLEAIIVKEMLQDTLTCKSGQLYYVTL